MCVDRPRTQTVSGDRQGRRRRSRLPRFVPIPEAGPRSRSSDFRIPIAVMLTSGGVRTLVVTIYRPDGRNNAFYGEFESLLEMIVVYNCNFVILGDVNVHLDVTTDPASKKFSSIVDSFGLRQMVETATHQAGHTLDVVLVRGDRSDGVSIIIQPPVISDHSVIMIELPVYKPPPVSFNATWKNFDREAFHRELTASVLCSSGDAWSEMSIDDLAESYSSILTSLVDRFAPRIVVKKHHRPITPWFNAVCLAEKRRSRGLERVYRRTRLARDRTLWISQLRSAQLVYQQVQHEYWQMLITNSSGNARKLWNTLSSVMGRNRGSPIQPGLTADAFSKFFSDKVDDVRSSTAGSAEPEFTVFLGHPLDEFIQLSISDVVRLIRDSPSKACGLDPIPTCLMKEFVDQLDPYLTYLFNRSLSQGRFPEIFRLAEVTPILKKSTLDPSVLSSYRPISNLPFISKVLERAVNERMLQHLHSNGLLPEHQSAYRRSHSTETALLKVTSDALIAADQGRLTLLGMLDLSSAFDCVDHDILLSRLETSFGFAGLVLDWMRSYLVGRKQYVRYSGTTSSTTVMMYGVPQGSVLHPLYCRCVSNCRRAGVLHPRVCR